MKNRLAVSLFAMLLIGQLFFSPFAHPSTPTFDLMEEAACTLYARMNADVVSGACPDDACLRDLIKPQRICEWRLKGVMMACAAGNPDQARTKLLAAYNPTRNHIGQMLDHCRDGLSNCDLIASYIGGDFIEAWYLLQDYPDCPNSFACIKAELWAFGDTNPPLLSPLGDNDLNLMGWMKAKLDQANVCE